MPQTIPDAIVFNALLDESRDQIYIIDRDLHYARVSRSAARAVGLTPEQMTGRSWRELGLPAETLEPLERQWREVLATGTPLSRDLSYNTPEGRRWFEYHVFPIRSDDAVVGIVVLSRDITERYLGEDRYRTFLANSSEAIWRFEVDAPIDAALPEDEQIDLVFARGYLAECNDAMARMYGFERAEEIAGARLPDMLDPTQQHNREFLRDFIRGGYRLTDAESIETDRFGNRKYFINSFVGVVENGNLVRAWGTQRDITEQKAAVEAIRLSEQRLQALVASTAQIVWTADPKGALKSVSAAWTEVTGQSDEEAKGFGWLSTIHDDDRDEMTQHWREALRSRARYRHVVRIRNRSGEHCYFEIRSAPVLEDDGIVREWVGACVDVDAERRQEEALAAERTRAEFIVEANDLFTRSLDYEQTLRNLAALAVPRLADWCAVDMLEPDGSFRRLAVEHPDPNMVRLAFELTEKYPADPASTSGIHEVARTGKTTWMRTISDSVLESRLRSPEQLEIVRKLRLRSYIAAPIKLRDRVAGVLTLVNTDRSRPYTEADVFLAEELALRAGHAIENARLYQQALDANRAKDEFLATLSHELRTPLTSILGWAHMTRLSNYDPETVHTAIETIERSAQTQATLIDDLLDISRIVTGKFRLEPEQIDIVPIVRDVVASSRPAAEAKRMEITLDAPPSVIIRVDPSRLQQIVWNLVSNAVKFSLPDGRVDVKIEPDGGGEVRIRVTDQGVGITPEVLPRVFERFWQADSSPDRVHGGLGLGLAIVKHLTEMHGGSVSAESAGLGHGATFTVTLPVHVAAGVSRPAG